MALCPLVQFPPDPVYKALAFLVSAVRLITGLHPAFLQLSWITSSVHAAAPSFPSLTGLLHILFLPHVYLLPFKKYLFII